jgi:hypothetical protein
MKNIMKTSSKKTKGRRLQQLVRDKLLTLHPSLRAEDIKSTPMGVTGEDVQLSPYARDLLPIQIETKSWKDKRLPVYEFYDQCKNHGNHEPVVVIKNNRKKPLVIVDLDHYVELWKKVLEI